MKFILEIGGKDYTFEMNRQQYKKLLCDENYAKMQNDVSLKSDEKEDVTDINKLMINNLLMEEKIIHYALLLNQPNITEEETSKLVDIAYEEYGAVAVGDMATKLIENFSRGEVETKKTMNLRMI